MTFKEYERAINSPLLKTAEARVFNTLRGGFIVNDYFYYPDGRGVHRVHLYECEDIKELEGTTKL